MHHVCEFIHNLTKKALVLLSKKVVTMYSFTSVLFKVTVINH